MASGVWGHKFNGFPRQCPTYVLELGRVRALQVVQGVDGRCTLIYEMAERMQQSMALINETRNYGVVAEIRNVAVGLGGGVSRHLDNPSQITSISVQNEYGHSFAVLRNLQ